jgi:hypothetical protein
VLAAVLASQTWHMSVVVPAAVELLLTADVAQEIAVTFGDLPVYPQRILVDSPAGPSLT